jgi:hypothetical protein
LFEVFPQDSFVLNDDDFFDCHDVRWDRGEKKTSAAGSRSPLVCHVS